MGLFQHARHSRPCDTMAKPPHAAPHTRIMGLIRLKVILLHQPYCYGSLPVAEGSGREYVQCPIYFMLTTAFCISKHGCVETENIDSRTVKLGLSKGLVVWTVSAPYLFSAFRSNLLLNIVHFLLSCCSSCGGVSFFVFGGRCIWGLDAFSGA